MGVRSIFGSFGDPKMGSVVDIMRRGGTFRGGRGSGNGGAKAKGVEGATEEEEVEEEEEEKGKQKHDDGLEEEGKEVGVRFWLENTQSMRE